MIVLSNLVLGLFLNVVASIVDYSVAATTDEMFYVVSPSSGAEKYYLKLSRSGARNEGSSAREDATCATILKSPFFATDEKNDVEMVHPSNVQAYAQFHPEGKSWSMFTRPYKPVNVSVEPHVTHEEAVFPCLAKFNGGTNEDELKLYLVSHAYDLNRWIDGRRSTTKCPEVTGHFIFEFSGSGNVARLIAIAEEPARRLNYEYVAERKDDKIDHLLTDLEAISNGGRSICKFTARRKVRICSIGLNANEYRSMITFLPLENSVEPKCEMKELVFKYDKYTSSSNSSTTFTFEFDEWVIGCKAELHRKPGTYAMFYVSLGYEPYQFLIYHRNVGKSNSSYILRYHFYSHLGADNSDYDRF